jgi:phage FluMu protein Com
MYLKDKCEVCFKINKFYFKKHVAKTHEERSCIINLKTLYNDV